MKRAQITVLLTPKNDQQVQAMQAGGKVSPAIFDLLHLVAEVLDQAVAGEDIYMTLGTNQDKSALLLTVTWDRQKMRISGYTLEDLAAQAHTLL